MASNDETINKTAESLNDLQLNSEEKSMVGTRGGGYGLDAELARKQQMKYDVNAEQAAQTWIETIISEQFPGPTFGESLKNGQILCKLINAIKPGTIRKIETSNMPFKQMENISNYLKACRALGVAETDLFETVDLFELKDLGLVVQCIHCLGSAVQSTVPEFPGPHLGVKRADKNRRVFTSEQIQKSSYESSVGNKQTMGSYGKMERASVDASRNITFGAEKVGTGTGHGTSKLDQGSHGMESPQFVQSRDITSGAKPDAKMRKETSKFASLERELGVEHPVEQPIAEQKVSTGPVGTRGAGYGLDAELAAQREAKYDVSAEGEAQQWIEGVTGEAFSGPTFGESLKNGQLLCKLINTIQPGTIRKIETSNMPFKQMENISNFLRACRALTVAETDLFETVDLFELKDLGIVVRCIHALGSAVQDSVPDFPGPHLGVKKSQKNVRRFSEDKLKKAAYESSMGSKQTMGSYGQMERMGVDVSKNITFGAEKAGTGSCHGESKLDQGSYGIMERSHIDRKNDITFGNENANK